MKKNSLQFNELRELLLELGFAEADEEKKSVRFVHPATETFLLFHVYGPKEIVNDRDMLVVRRQLVENGLIEASALDGLLQKASA